MYINNVDMIQIKWTSNINIIRTIFLYQHECWQFLHIISQTQHHLVQIILKANSYSPCLLYDFVYHFVWAWYGLKTCQVYRTCKFWHVHELPFHSTKNKKFSLNYSNIIWPEVTGAIFDVMCLFRNNYL